MTTAQWLRAAAARISRGSGRLCTLIARRITGKGLAKGRSWWAGITGWLGEASGLAWILRLALLLLGALVLRKILTAIALGIGHRADSARLLLWPLLIAWIIAAYRVGHPDWEPKPEPTPESPSKQPADEEDDDQAEPDKDESPVEPEPELPPPPLLPNIEDLRIAMAEVGTPHAHITALAEQIGTTPDRVREALAKWHIPIEPVRMKGRGSSTGVKGDPFPTPLPDQELPSESVVAAGQTANNDNNNGPTVDRSEWGITITDPADTHRQQAVRQV